MDLYIIITDFCNLKCDFCIRHNLKTITKGNIDKDSFVMVLDLMCTEFDIRTVVLTGGEPTLHPDVFGFIDTCIQKGLSVVVASNGTFSEMTRDKLARSLGKGLALQISIDGTSATHNKLRGNYTFEKATSNLSALTNYQEFIVVSTTVSKENFDDVIQLADQLNNYSFHHWKVSPCQVESPSKDSIIAPEIWNKFVTELIHHCRFRVHVSRQFDFDLWDRAIEKGAVPNGSIMNNCGLGKSKIYVDKDCNVMPCTCMPDIIGNLKIDDPKLIHDRLAKLSNIKPDPDSICATCKYTEICNGGCPGYSLKYFGAFNRGDIRCPKIII